MLNIKDKIYDAIKDIAENVGDSYAAVFANFPGIQYSEEENKVYQWSDNREQSSIVRYRFDIWDRVSTTALAIQVDDKVSALGLKRIQCMDVDDESGLKHKIIRYEGIINPYNNMVTHLK